MRNVVFIQFLIKNKVNGYVKCMTCCSFFHSLISMLYKLWRPLMGEPESRKNSNKESHFTNILFTMDPFINLLVSKMNKYILIQLVWGRGQFLCLCCRLPDNFQYGCFYHKQKKAFQFFYTLLH